jgi:hypothetical protein
MRSFVHVLHSENSILAAFHNIPTLVDVCAYLTFIPRSSAASLIAAHNSQTLSFLAL